MRKDLNKVVTERERHNSRSRNLKTAWHTSRYDEADEDKVSLPKHGKMVMRNKELEIRKDFSDNLRPVERWANSQVGRPWNKVFSEIKKTFPPNKLNNHLVYTHLIRFFNISKDLDNEVVAKVYIKSNLRSFTRMGTIHPYKNADNGWVELMKDELYVDPLNGIVKRYTKGTKTRHWYRDAYKDTTKSSTGYVISRDRRIEIDPNKMDGFNNVEQIKGLWFFTKVVKRKNPLLWQTEDVVLQKKALSKKWLKIFGVANDLEWVDKETKKQ